MARIAAALLLAGLWGAPACAQDMTVLVPPPPAADDPHTIHDIATLRALQTARTPDEIRAAQADVDESAFLFRSVLGPGFDARRLPRTADLMARAGEAASAAMNRAKAVWNRPRPSAVAPDLRPCLPVPATSSYPNGHAVLGMVYAGLLGRMLPEHRAALFARAREYAEHRESCGLHFPGDTEAGYAVAAAIGAVFPTPALDDIARTELRPALGLPTALPVPLPAAPEPPPSEDFRVR
jgi:acid phosphatase (class A)